eukprot:scaffold27_cov182-Ochromonas_danica.AAC.5
MEKKKIREVSLGQKMIFLVCLKEIPRRRHLPIKTPSYLISNQTVKEEATTTTTTTTNAVVDSDRGFLEMVIPSKSDNADAAAKVTGADSPTMTTTHVTPTTTTAATDTLTPLSSVCPSSLLILTSQDSQTANSRLYDKEKTMRAIYTALQWNESHLPHVLMHVVKDVEYQPINLLIELIHVSQPAATSPTTTTTSDNSFDLVSIMEDFANSFAQAFYEEGCKQSLFDPINYEAECEIELNSEVAQTKMLMIKKGWSALLASCFLGYVEIVQLLLSDSSMDVNEADEKNGISAFHYACSRHVEVVRLLLSDGRVAVNKASKDGRTPLHYASSEGHVEVVRLLLSHSQLDANPVRWGRITALHDACIRGHIEVVKLLLSDSRVDVNKASVSGTTALHFACYYGYVIIVKMLLSDGQLLDVNQVDEDGQTALDLTSSEEIKEMLIEKGGIRKKTTLDN